jgi:type II secretory pathway predicted ATPase ExeA
MYYSHFGLTQPPFRITPNTEFFYSGGNRGPILEALIYAISQGEGIIKVTGEVGSGKTMLCNMLQSRLPPNVETVYIANPSVSPDEIVQAIALELHLKPPRDAGHLELMQLIHAHLLERHAGGKQVVMFVEESQSMPIATLEEIRLLSNLETAHSKLLQIVLFGQPELEDNLRGSNIRQLRERITHSFRLSPLKPPEIGDYLNFRLRAAGYRGPDLFSPAIVRAMARASDGLTRRINLIADKAMLAAFAENTHTIKLKHVEAAIRDSEFSHYETPQPPLRWGFALGVIGVGAAICLLLPALMQRYPPPAVTETPAVPVQPALVAPAAPVPAPSPAETPPAAVETTPTPAPTAEASPPAAAGALAANAASAPATPSGPLEKSKQIVNKQSVETAPPKAGKSGDIVEERLLATREWLAQPGNNAVSIQLLGVDNQQQLKNHLNVIAKYVEINEVFVYRTIAKQKPSTTVLYGSFADRRAAEAALKQLPAPLKSSKPILRTVQGIRAEIAQNQTP